MNCPDCGGPMWDNRDNKRNPKQPDFKCKDKDGCGKGVWEQRSEGGNGAARQGGKGSNGASASPRIQRPLGPLYNDCLTFAKQAADHHFGKGGTAPEHVIAMAATLLIQAARDGSPIRAPKPAAPKPKPEPEPEQEYDDERSIPF